MGHQMNASERIKEAFFTSKVDRQHVLERMQAILAEMFQREPADTGKPVIYLPNPFGFNSAIGDGFKDRGFEVRYLKDYGDLRKASPSCSPSGVSGAEQDVPCWETTAPAESGTHDPSVDQAPGAKATPPAGTSAGDPSQTIVTAHMAETIGEPLRDISSGITLHIGTLNINF